MNCCDANGNCNQGRDCPVRRALRYGGHVPPKPAPYPRRVSAAGDITREHDVHMALQDQAHRRDTDFIGLTPIDHILYRVVVVVLCAITAMLAFGFGCWMLDLHRDAIAALYGSVLRAWL